MGIRNLPLNEGRDRYNNVKEWYWQYLTFT